MRFRSGQLLLVGLAVTAMVAGATMVAARGPNKARPTVYVTDDGDSVSTVTVDTQFGVAGENFRESFPVRVCITGGVCQDTETDRDGRFQQGRTVTEAGIVTVYAFQPRNRRELRNDSWDLLAAKTINVTE